MTNQTNFITAGSRNSTPACNRQTTQQVKYNKLKLNMKNTPPKQHITAIYSMLILCTMLKSWSTAATNTSNTTRYRLSWCGNPCTEAAIGWEATDNSTNSTVLYDTVDHGQNTTLYTFTQTVSRVRDFSYRGTLQSCFAELTNLSPDTAYYFVIRDNAGVSPRLWFRTAPNTRKAFAFIAGGDSRSNRAPRRKCNRLVAKLRPLFVAFTGDMTSSDKVSDWRDWLDDWQETISEDGRIYPILPHVGNHEQRKDGRIDRIFDIPELRYYSITIGGDLFRYYVLNSEIEQGGAQTQWLTNDLAHASGITHKAAGYHRPMRPHHDGKSPNNEAYTNWSYPFFNYGVRLVFEADSHCMKRTWPIEPVGLGNGDEGFIRNDTNGIVFAGEGCWGAPLRTPDNDKSWTRASAEFYGFQLIHVYQDYIELFTVKADNAANVTPLDEDNTLTIPAGLSLWTPSTGARVVINSNTINKISYAQWQLNIWGNQIPDGCSQADDADGDGLINLSEFSFGLNPNHPDDTYSNTTIFPEITTTNGISMSFRRTRNASLKYTYHWGQSLTTWHTLSQNTDYTMTTSGTGDTEIVKLNFSDRLINTNTPIFIRVKTSLP